MKQRNAATVFVILALTLAALSACQTQNVNVRVTGHSQSQEADGETANANMEALTYVGEKSRSWPLVLLFAVGVPLSLIGAVTVLYFARELRKKNATQTIMPNHNGMP